MTLKEDPEVQKDSAKIALLWSNPYAYEIANVLIAQYHLRCHSELTTLENMGMPPLLVLQTAPKS